MGEMYGHSLRVSCNRTTLLIYAVLFKVYVHTDSIIFNRTRFEIASGGKLPDLVFCICSIEQHGLKGPFR